MLSNIFSYQINIYLPLLYVQELFSNENTHVFSTVTGFYEQLPPPHDKNIVMEKLPNLLS